MSEILTDFLILAGALLAGCGLYFVYWPLVLVWVGLLFLAAGIARLPGRK